MTPDNCCWACRSPTGVCLTRWQCEHHREAERAADANDRARQTVRRPTEDQAIRNITRQQRKKGHT